MITHFRILIMYYVWRWYSRTALDIAEEAEQHELAGNHDEAVRLMDIANDELDKATVWFERILRLA